MALQKCALNVNNKNKELQPHGTLEFPCAGYASTHTDSIRDFISWHWHEEVEVIHIAKGNMNSVFASKYVIPLISCSHFSCIVLKDKNQSVSDWFSTAFEALKNDAFAYEFTVREQLSHIILSVYSELEPQLNDSHIHQEINFIRVAKILSFIERHYPENITLSNIAETVNLSERETLRCFRKVIGESPIQYLLKYRLIQSASTLIRYPDKKISVVAEECGFDSPAYFAKKFKEFYLCTPREYRQTYQGNFSGN